MSKIYLSDLYDVSGHLFVNNSFITGDASLNFLAPYYEDLDLIASMIDNREFFSRYLDENNNYVVTKIRKGVWASLVANREKYKKLIAIDELTYNPLSEYDIVKEYGQDKTTKNYGQDVTTNAYGQDVTTDVNGQQQDSITTAPRNATSTAFSTCFDSTAENETGKSIDTTTQTVDTSTSQAYTDTHTRDARNDTSTRQARVDDTTRQQHTDTERGHRQAPQVLIEKQRQVANYNTLELIVADTVNYLTYGIYL